MNGMPEPADYLPDLEEHVLGALLIGDGYGRVQGFLRADHFCNPDYAAIYAAIGQAFELCGKTPAGLVGKILTAESGRALELRSNLSVPQLLGRLVSEATFTAANIERGAGAVVDQWARLRAKDEFARALEAASDHRVTFTSIARHVGAELDALGMEVRSADRRRSRMTIGEAGRLALANTRAAVESGTGLTGVPWGPLKSIDRLTGGLQASDLIIVGARPSMGKTTFATTVSVGAARKGHGVGFFSLEMSTPSLTNRVVSELSHTTHCAVPYADIVQGHLDDRQMAHLADLTRRLEEFPIEIDDAPAGVFDLRARVESMAERFAVRGWPKLELVVVDHLGCVRPSSAYRGNRNNEVAEMTGGLKAIAKEFAIPVLVLSQLSREVAKRDDKRPQLADLRDSGAIEQDADVIGFVHREAYYLERSRSSDPDDDMARQDRLDACRHDLEFIIAKQRQGRTETVDLWADMAFSTIRDRERYR